MPRHVRNFWINGRIDGRDTPIAGGPQSKDGGFSLTIMQRDDGDVIEAVSVWGVAMSDGRVLLRVEDAQGNRVHTVETTR